MSVALRGDRIGSGDGVDVPPLRVGAVRTGFSLKTTTDRLGIFMRAHEQSAGRRFMIA